MKYEAEITIECDESDLDFILSFFDEAILNSREIVECEVVWEELPRDSQ